MNLILENAPFAWLAALIAVPPLLHLFARARPPRYAFSATALVLQVVRQTMRLRRPRDWLLLACRTLLAAALAGLFLRPVLYTRGVPEPGAPARTLVVLVDRSASMAWAEGGQSRFGAACAEAARALADLSSRDRANLIWIDAEPDAVFPECGPNAAYLRARLAEARVSHEGGNPQAALDLARAQLANAEGRRELCILSDFQATQWRGVRADLPRDVRVFTLSTARGTAGNGAVADLRTEPARPLAGEPAQVICEVANFSPDARTRTVTLDIDGRRVSQAVMIPPWGRGTVAVPHQFRQAGDAILTAVLDEDALGSDDWRGAATPVRDALRIGLLGEDARVTPVWRRALRAIPWTDEVRIEPGREQTAADLDLLLLAGWNGAGADALAALHAQGLSIVCAPAEGLTLAALARLAGGATDRAGAFTWDALAHPLGLTADLAADPAFALFRGGDHGDPTRGTFRRRWVAPLPPDGGTPLLAFTDGAPALFRWRSSPASAPSLLLWLAPLDADSGDWAAQIAFLPLFGELVGNHRSRRPALPTLAHAPGDPLTWLAPLHAEGIHLLNTRDEVMPLQSATLGADGRHCVSAPIADPGLYRWIAGDRVQATRIVNFPPAESDLRAGPPPEFGAATGRSLAAGEAVHAAGRGQPLWPWLLALALALALVESLLVLDADRHHRRLAGAA